MDRFNSPAHTSKVAKLKAQIDRIANPYLSDAQRLNVALGFSSEVPGGTGPYTRTQFQIGGHFFTAVTRRGADSTFGARHESPAHTMLRKAQTSQKPNEIDLAAVALGRELLQEYITAASRIDFRHVAGELFSKAYGQPVEVRSARLIDLKLPTIGFREGAIIRGEVTGHYIGVRNVAAAGVGLAEDNRRPLFMWIAPKKGSSLPGRILVFETFPVRGNHVLTEVQLSATDHIVPLIQRGHLNLKQKQQWFEEAWQRAASRAALSYGGVTTLGQAEVLKQVKRQVPPPELVEYQLEKLNTKSIYEAVSALKSNKLPVVPEAMLSYLALAAPTRHPLGAPWLGSASFSSQPSEVGETLADAVRLLGSTSRVLEGHSILLLPYEFDEYCDFSIFQAHKKPPTTAQLHAFLSRLPRPDSGAPSHQWGPLPTYEPSFVTKTDHKPPEYPRTSVNVLTLEAWSDAVQDGRNLRQVMGVQKVGIACRTRTYDIEVPDDFDTHDEAALNTYCTSLVETGGESTPYSVFDILNRGIYGNNIQGGQSAVLSLTPTDIYEEDLPFLKGKGPLQRISSQQFRHYTLSKYDLITGARASLGGRRAPTIFDGAETMIFHPIWDPETRRFINADEYLPGLLETRLREKLKERGDDILGGDWGTFNLSSIHDRSVIRRRYGANVPDPWIFREIGDRFAEQIEGGALRTAEGKKKLAEQLLEEKTDYVMQLIEQARSGDQSSIGKLNTLELMRRRPRRILSAAKEVLEGFVGEGFASTFTTGSRGRLNREQMREAASRFGVLIRKNGKGDIVKGGNVDDIVRSMENISIHHTYQFRLAVTRGVEGAVAPTWASVPFKPSTFLSFGEFWQDAQGTWRWSEGEGAFVGGSLGKRMKQVDSGLSVEAKILYVDFNVDKLNELGLMHDSLGQEGYNAHMLSPKSPSQSFAMWDRSMIEQMYETVYNNPQYSSYFSHIQSEEFPIEIKREGKPSLFVKKNFHLNKVVGPTLATQAFEHGGSFRLIHQDGTIQEINALVGLGEAIEREGLKVLGSLCHEAAKAIDDIALGAQEMIWKLESGKVEPEPLDSVADAVSKVWSGAERIARETVYRVLDSVPLATLEIVDADGRVCHTVDGVRAHTGCETAYVVTDVEMTGAVDMAEDPSVYRDVLGGGDGHYAILGDAACCCSAFGRLSLATGLLSGAMSVSEERQSLKSVLGFAAVVHAAVSSAVDLVPGDRISSRELAEMVDAVDKMFVLSRWALDMGASSDSVWAMSRTNAYGIEDTIEASETGGIVGDARSAAVSEVPRVGSDRTAASHAIAVIKGELGHN